MRRFLARRLAHGAAVLFIAVSISFFLVHLAPGDPFSPTVDGRGMDAATRARLRAEFGLDRPLGEQYVRFLGQIATGNLGPSLSRHRPAAEILKEAVPHTLLLMGTALVLSFAMGVALGAWQAARRGSVGDRVAGTTSLVIASLPEFWLGLVLMLVFAYKLRLLPTSGAVELGVHHLLSPAARIADRAKHLVLPAVTLALIGAGSIARYQRAALLDVLPHDFVRTARAKGLSERRVLWHHALRNALVPTIALAGLSLPALLGGAVFVEHVFSWPGMGRVAADAFASRDYNVVVGATMLGALLVVIGGIATDVLHAVVDPRVRAS